ncbi:hypothetical protein [Bythopirellula goksoeyrii]|uniref:Uncharacterized protein n=1 Tax=Bythopirellula goksoeyrii TaxID=1400387 RepID=A0A5B9QEK2_9BACT|nr:hypothetical protein [Bythopirellula goksoeyrii]QEG35922.1 hypothetical protein Pr1d_32300 [Bythopirellula goksoeyrii]
MITCPSELAASDYTSIAEILPAVLARYGIESEENQHDSFAVLGCLQVADYSALVTQ